MTRFLTALYLLALALPAGAQDLAQTAGKAVADWTGGSFYSGGTAGRTIVLTGRKHRFRQEGTLRRVVINRTADAPLSAGTRKIKVVRASADPAVAGSTWTVVGESEVQVNPGTAGSETADLASPITGVAVGDYLAIYLSDSVDESVRIGATADADGAVQYGDGDLTTGGTLGTLASGFSVHLAGFDYAPELSFTGDSIPEGHNVGSHWHNYLHTGAAIGGTQRAEVAWHLRTSLADPDYRYQNHALGSQTWAWVRSTGMPAAVASEPEALWLHCGINDLFADRTWAAVEADIRDCVAQAGETRLIVSEVMPCSEAWCTDLKAAELRTWNANIRALASELGFEVLACHDAMGQTRVSTGELDDLKTLYSIDGVHLTNEGCRKLALLLADQIDTGPALALSLASYYKLDEASGDFVDTRGGVNLTAVNSPGTAAGVVETSRSFNSGNQRYGTAADTALHSLGDHDFTITGWFYMASRPAEAAILSRYVSGVKEFLLYYTGGASGRVTLIVSGSSEVTLTLNSFGLPATDTWHFFCGGYDAEANVIYGSVNNGTVDTIAMASGPIDKPVVTQIGRYATSGYWNGRLDEIGYWKRKLTTAEVTRLYNGGAGLSYDEFEPAGGGGQGDGRPKIGIGLGIGIGTLDRAKGKGQLSAFTSAGRDYRLAF